jgi:hypothetical protein
MKMSINNTKNIGIIGVLIEVLEFYATYEEAAFIIISLTKKQ